MSEKTIVFSFGRMNPPTKGHEKLVEKVHSLAKEHKADHLVVLSHSQDSKKNPLTGEQKISHFKKLFPKTNVKLASKEIPDFMHHAAALHKQGYKHLVMVAGEDRAAHYKHELEKYNGHFDDKGRGYHFKSIKVVSAGEREKASEGTKGISATKMRGYASSGNYKEFCHGLPGSCSTEHAHEIYSDVRHGMGMSEEADRLAYIAGEIFNKGDLVEDLTTGEICPIEFRGDNYITIVTNNGNIEKRFLKDVMMDEAKKTKTLPKKEHETDLLNAPAVQGANVMEGSLLHKVRTMIRKVDPTMSTRLMNKGYAKMNQVAKDADKGDLDSALRHAGQANKYKKLAQPNAPQAVASIKGFEEVESEEQMLDEDYYLNRMAKEKAAANRERMTQDKILSGAIRARLAQDKPHKPTVNYGKMAQHILGAMGDSFPDSEPYEHLALKYPKLHDAGTLQKHLNIATRKHLGHRSFNQLLASNWDDMKKDQPDLLKHQHTNPWKEAANISDEDCIVEEMEVLLEYGSLTRNMVRMALFKFGVHPVKASAFARSLQQPELDNRQAFAKKLRDTGFSLDAALRVVRHLSPMKKEETDDSDEILVEGLVRAAHKILQSSDQYRMSGDTKNQKRLTKAAVMVLSNPAALLDFAKGEGRPMRTHLMQHLHKYGGIEGKEWARRMGYATEEMENKPMKTIKSFRDFVVGEPAIQATTEVADDLQEKAPPGMEDLVMKLKKQYPGQHEKAFATAWSIYNKKHGKVNAEELDQDFADACQLIEDELFSTTDEDGIVYTITEGSLDEKHIGFAKLKNKLAHRKGITNPGAVAAAIGREKYGKNKFQKAAAAGKSLHEQLAESVSRKHFQMVADTLKNIPDEGKRREMAFMHAKSFAKMNPNFSHEKFFKACNVPVSKPEWVEASTEVDPLLEAASKMSWTLGKHKGQNALIAVHKGEKMVIRTAPTTVKSGEPGSPRYIADIGPVRVHYPWSDIRRVQGHVAKLVESYDAEIPHELLPSPELRQVYRKGNERAEVWHNHMHGDNYDIVFRDHKTFSTNHEASVENHEKDEDAINVYLKGQGFSPDMHNLHRNAAVPMESVELEEGKDDHLVSYEKHYKTGLMAGKRVKAWTVANSKKSAHALAKDLRDAKVDAGEMSGDLYHIKKVKVTPFTKALNMDMSDYIDASEVLNEAWGSLYTVEHDGQVHHTTMFKNSAIQVAHQMAAREMQPKVYIRNPQGQSGMQHPGNKVEIDWKNENDKYGENEGVEMSKPVIEEDRMIAYKQFFKARLDEAKKKESVKEIQKRVEAKGGCATVKKTVKEDVGVYSSTAPVPGSWVAPSSEFDSTPGYVVGAYQMGGKTVKIVRMGDMFAPVKVVVDHEEWKDSNGETMTFTGPNAARDAYWAKINPATPAVQADTMSGKGGAYPKDEIKPEEDNPNQDQQTGAADS
jgi:hypothetical protein